MCAKAPRRRNSAMRGVCSPINASVRPTTLMTASRFMQTGSRRTPSCRQQALAALQLVDGLDDLGFVHGVHLHAAADARQQGDGQFAAEVLAEFLQAGEHGEAV